MPRLFVAACGAAGHAHRLHMGQHCAVAQAETMKRLLDQMGRPNQCDGCGRQIFWLLHRNGKWTPYTPQGLNHFIDCPERDRFQKKGAARGNAELVK